MAAYNRVRSVIERFCKGISMASMAIILAVTFMIAIDVALRFLTEDKAILGTYELTEVAMVAIIFLSMAITQIEKGHIRVEMFVEILPPRVKSFINALISLITTAVAGIVFYTSVLAAIEGGTSGKSTSVLHVPIFPFTWIMALGMLALTIVLLLDAIDCFVKAIKGPGPARL
ncbi:MAG: TRAP transporter small permease [Clostridiales Family XIII bacterium]|jgi:TRAP-type C4-dicarboxylate transport system permease small subunit|nr:TRAP transporter small permease [Clostridiales Family XIII bacterium]